MKRASPDVDRLTRGLVGHDNQLVGSLYGDGRGVHQGAGRLHFLGALRRPLDMRDPQSIAAASCQVVDAKSTSLPLDA